MPDTTLAPVDMSTDLLRLAKTTYELLEPAWSSVSRRTEFEIRRATGKASDVTFRSSSFEEAVRHSSQEADWILLRLLTLRCNRGESHGLTLDFSLDETPGFVMGIETDCDGGLTYEDRCDLKGLGDGVGVMASSEIAQKPWLMPRLRHSLSDGEVDWLIPGLLERGKLMALFGPPKSGKSLYALEKALQLTRDGKRVVYLDEENDASEVYERALDMGYDLADTDLDYHCFPGLNVDSEEDAEKLLELIGGPDLVVFDSWAKFFAHGSQSDDAAINRAYRLILKPLRQSGVAVMRLDHTGHTESRRPAGSVQKLADVDHNWLIKAEGATGRSARKVTLTHTENRTGRGDDVIVMDRKLGPLRHVVRGQEEAPEDLEASEIQEARTRAVIDALDAIGAPVDWSVSQCVSALQQSGSSARKGIVGDAQRARRASLSS